MMWDLSEFTKQGFVGKHLKNVRFSQVTIETDDKAAPDFRDCDDVEFDGLVIKKRS